MQKFILVLLIFCAIGAKSCSKKRKEKMQTIQKHPYSQIFSKNVAQLVGNYLEPQSASKMKLTNNFWTKIDVYEKYFPDDEFAFLVRHKETGQLMWNDPMDLICKKEYLLKNLIRNANGKWNALFGWLIMYRWRFDETWERNYKMYKKSISFAKSLMLVVSENIDVLQRGLLHVAAQIGDEKSLRKLIARGANVDEFYHSRNPLERAAHFGHESCCRILLENNADVNLREQSTKMTPLMSAAEQGLWEIVKLLLENGADKNLRNRNGHKAFALPFLHPCRYARGGKWGQMKSVSVIFTSPGW